MEVEGISTNFISTYLIGRTDFPNVAYLEFIVGTWNNLYIYAVLVAMFRIAPFEM